MGSNYQKSELWAALGSKEQTPKDYKIWVELGITLSLEKKLIFCVACFHNRAQEIKVNYI